MNDVSHYPGCWGCGQGENGLRVTGQWDGERLTVEHVPAPAYQGGPGLVHGGYLAALADEILGLVAAAVQPVPPMSRHLEIDYRAAAAVGKPLAVSARVEDRSGRKLVATMDATNPDGGVCFTARGIYVSVPLERWLKGLGQGEVDQAVLRLDQQNPADYLRLHTAWLDERAARGEVTRDLSLELRLRGVEPGTFTVTVGSGRAQLATGPAGGDPTVRVNAPFDVWRDYCMHTIGLGELAAAERVEIAGDAAALDDVMRVSSPNGAAE